MVRIASVEDTEFPGYKRAIFEDGTRSVGPAESVSSLLAEQDRRESFAVPPAVKQAQAERASQMTAQNAPSAQPVLFSDPGQSRPQAAPTATDAAYGAAPQMSMERPKTQPVTDGFVPMRPAEPPPAPTMGQAGTELFQAGVQQALRPRVVGASAGFDPVKYDASLSAVRQGMTEQTSGGRYYDPAAQQRIHEAELAARQIATEDEINKRRELEAISASKMLEAETVEDDLRSKQAEAERTYSDRMGALNQEARDIGQLKPDRKRLLNDMGADQKMAFAIAAALTGYITKGAGVAPMIANFNEMVQRDIDSQWKEIENKKSLNDNALGRMIQQFGSVQAGKQALSIAAEKAFLARAERQAAGINTQDARNAYKNLEASMLPGILEEEAKHKADFIGNISRSIQSQFVSPKAATAGHLEGPSAEVLMKTGERLQEFEAKGMVNEAKSLENSFVRQYGATPEQYAKQGEQRSKDVQEYGKRFDAIASGTSAIDKVIAENGIKPDPKGDLVPPDDLAGFGALGGASAPAAIVSDKGMANRAALNSIVAAVAIKRFGAYNPTQGESIREEIIGNGSARTITTNLGVIKRELESARENMKASFSPEVHQQYTRNLGVSRAVDQQKKGFKPAEGL